jgi:NADH-quinone oxidoreductase subunit L
MDNANIPNLLLAAWLLPLVSFTIIVFLGPKLGKHGIAASWVATAAIVCSFLCSATSMVTWWDDFREFGASAHVAGHEPEFGGHAAEDAAHQVEKHGHDEHVPTLVAPKSISGVWYKLGQFGKLKITISYFIDALTIAMFTMVTLIASCIHFYAIGYMHDELHDITDHQVTLSDGHHLHRHGRFHRFFQYLSLFCFSMLGIVVAGNVAMIFVFWELVGICSYFLIGFYIERKSASNAANKAFIVNRVGDFGMIIGMMALWASLGTFAFGDNVGDDGKLERGIFSQVRSPENNFALVTPAGMVRAAASSEVADIFADHATDEKLDDPKLEVESRIDNWRKQGYGYGLLIVAGLGIFCGCVGKSAQFPLHVWLPDAMEGPTPVSALVHSATMVAAGVYLVGRFYPVFTPEVLLVIAYVGAITLILAATIAITATDIKRVLAYSTVSQLGYMMLALGVGGWVAGMFHLITHAFFKSLLFMCSGSVIHATHTNEMTEMGGLRKKMPWTAYTMLAGCLAIIGAGVPFLIGFSGYYSKDAIIAQALSFWQHNPKHGAVFFTAAAGGAAITAFYMFRLWYLTFAGEPRNHHVYDHAHESPKIMYMPLIVLAVFAVITGWTLPGAIGVADWLESARPAGLLHDKIADAIMWTDIEHPNEHFSHETSIHVTATIVAFSTALVGFLLATAFYGWRYLNPADVRQQFSALYTFLVNKWYFDELYRAIFVRPVMFIAGVISRFDKLVIDGLIDNLARGVLQISRLDDAIDRYFVDGVVNLTAHWTYSIGNSFRRVQTGKLRQYVMLIVIGTVALTVLIKWSVAAGP